MLTGQVAKTVAGPAVVLSYLASGIACVFSGLCYAEFAARIPKAGSAYLYAYYSLGEFVAWFIGWDLVLEVRISGLLSLVDGRFTDFSLFLCGSMCSRRQLSRGAGLATCGHCSWDLEW